MVSGETAGLKIKPAFGAWIMRMFRYKWNANTSSVVPTYPFHLQPYINCLRDVLGFYTILR